VVCTHGKRGATALTPDGYLDCKEITPDEIYVWADKMNTTPKTEITAENLSR